MAEVSVIDEREVLAGLDFTPDLGSGALAGTVAPPEGRVNRQPSPVVERLMSLIADQALMLGDGSGDRNFPNFNAFNSSI